MKPQTVAILRSPMSHEPLRLVSEPGPDADMLESLVSFPAGERFPVRDGVPLLLNEASLSGLNQRYRGFYDTVARLYDPAIRLAARLVGAREDVLRWEYLQELEVQPGQRVLEVSIGTGANMRCLRADVAYFGLDISWGMLKRCRDNLKKWGLDAELILGNAEELPFCDETFDAVLHVGGINAFNDRGKSIREMIRVARGGARIVVVDETAKLMESFSWIPRVKQILQEYRDRFSAPVDLVPEGMVDVRVKAIIGERMYCLVFRKP